MKSRAFRAALGALFIFVAGGLGVARARPPEPSLYTVLGVSAKAPPEAIEAAFKARASRSTTAEERGKLLSAFLILSNAEYRKGYDEGKPLEVEIAPEDRAKVAQLLARLDPAASSLLLKTGRVAGDQLSGAVGFYVASSVSQYWQCFRTGDPDTCTQYLDGLKDWTGYAGFGAFVGTSAGTSWLASWALRHGAMGAVGKGVVGSAAVNMLGLSAGMMASDIFAEIIHHPDFEAWQQAKKIADPKDRDAQTSAAERALWKDTFGNAEWWGDKAPMIAGSALGASAMTGGTFYALGKSAQAILKVKANSVWLACIQRGLRAVMGEPKTAGGAIAQKGAKNLAQLLMFFGYSNLATPLAQKVWNQASLQPALDKSRKRLDGGAALSPADLQTALSANDHLWDRYRRTLMAKADSVLATHGAENGKIDNALGEPDLFYSWFLGGMKEDDPSWQNLQQYYYTPSTRPSDVAKDTEKYLRGFFCGTDPKASFKMSGAEDISSPVTGKAPTFEQRLRIPFEGRVSVTPYRVVDDAKLCQASVEEMKAALMTKDPKLHNQLRDALLKAQTDFDNSTQAEHNERIRVFEALVHDQLVASLAGSSAKRASLPAGVLPAFDAQLADLARVKTSLATAKSNAKNIAAVDTAIANVQRKRKAAQELYDYITTDPSKRAAPKVTLDSILDAVGAKKKSDVDEVVSYFNGYILK